jgi:mannose-6-phosphate isomerase-like protein (cupin superfamily)
MTAIRTLVFLTATALVAAAPTPAAAEGATVVTPSADLQWKDMGNGVSAAQVSGDMGAGASRFFLKYPVGLVTPNHHHDADHYATLVSGTVSLDVGGKQYTLGPGSYFALTGKAPHVAKVTGDEPAVFFIQADGPWNVVADE